MVEWLQLESDVGSVHGLRWADSCTPTLGTVGEKVPRA